MNTPGIYIKEKLARPVTLSGASTAVPVLIGYTELAVVAPQRISGMLDFHNLFGQAYTPSFSVQLNATDEVEEVVPDFRYFLYDTLSLYFLNGGGPCYVISIGTYTDTGSPRQKFVDAFAELDLLTEVSLVLAPDLHAEKRNGNGQTEAIVSISDRNFLRGSLLDKVGLLQDKFAIFDLDPPSLNPHTDANQFRNGIVPGQADDLKYGAAYYPWVRSAERPLVGFDRLSLSNSYAGDPLVDQAMKYRNDVQAIETEYGFSPTAAGCRSRYEALKADFLAAVGNTKKGKFSNIIKYFYSLVAGLDNLSLTTTELSVELAGQMADEKLRSCIQILYRFKGILGAHSGPSFLTTTGFAYPADSSWFNTALTSYVAGTDVESDVALLSDYDQMVNGPSSGYSGWASAELVLADLESGMWVEPDRLFGAVSSVYAAAISKMETAASQLMQFHPAYSNAGQAVEEYLRSVPSQGAVAGAYCTNDRLYGVWRSPANLALEGLSGPVVAVTNAAQDGLNVHPNTGKSINCIRTFTGKGTLIWGARTLAGRSNEWRYIAVRRFFTFAEQSIRNTAEAFLFAPNHARTWVQVKAAISGFLLEQWNNGALVGTTWEEAFEITVGQGNQADEMEILVGMAVARPAEFITVSFSQSMQNA